jgi:ankyrin repeat protein
MTSNGDPVLNASPRPGTPPRSAPKAASPSSKENRPQLHNGSDDHDDAQNESEAETVVLSPEKRVIKTERTDDDNGAAHLRPLREESRAHPPLTNGHRRSSHGNEVRINGAKHGSERDAKSPVPTSPSSRTTSRHTKDTSPTDSNKSPVQSAHSPTQANRGRSASTADSRKRKVRDDSFPKSIEPPRQKAKTEGLKESRHPNSPATPGFARLHKRSQSTQSVVTGVAGRKRRETTNLALSVEPSRWPDDDYSSENSYSPPAHTPNPLQHQRLKRSSHRAFTSPARNMPKPKVDRFGATRLARESEKGDLDAVKEAFEEAPDELNQVDYAGIAPLQKASLHGWADVVRFLIKQGCNTACESNDRDTPLIDAVENGHLDVVRLLLNEGHVNPHHANKKGQRAIDVLDYEDDDADEIEKTLREAMKRETNTLRVDKQPERKQAKTASRLLYNEYNVETLIEKAGDGDILAVGELINSNIKPNITCGVAAARGGHYDILSILLASGLKADPDPSKHPETPMTVAIGRGHPKIIQLLLEQDHFDPTRRNKENKAYYEIAEEKAGPRWEMERDVLKQAYDEHKSQHRSPRRAKKEPPHLSAIRMKRNSLPKRDRSSSPRPDSKRAHLSKSSTAPQKSRRLMSGKEMASREGKRRKRVVTDESSEEEEESEEDVRPPTRKTKPRSHSLGEENKPAQQPLKTRSDDNDTAKRKARARSDESGDDQGSKPPPKIRRKVENPLSAKSTPDIDSPDERKAVKNKIKYKTMEDKSKTRKLSDASADHVSVKKTPTVSTKSTPAPPERIATPEAEREKRQEEQRLEVEARRKAAEAAAEAERQRKEEEEAARKAAEEVAAKRKAEAEAEARRQAEEAEATRKREEEEAQRRIEEESKRQKMLLARQDRISKLPRALRRACELGQNRPLHFSGEELGISAVFFPLYYATSQDLQQPASPSKTYLCSHQIVGILGLPELDLAHLDAPYSDWSRIPVTTQQRNAILRQCDVALLAQDFRFPMEGTPEFDYAKIEQSVKEARAQFLAMDGLYWVEESLLLAEAEGREHLQPLLNDIKPECSKRRFHLAGLDDKCQKPKPRKTFFDLVMEQKNGPYVNGDAG